MTDLYHWTCGHGLDGLGLVGSVTPPSLRFEGFAERLTELDPVIGPVAGGLAWFTDLGTPNRAALGLTMRRTMCDRTRYRYRVTDDGDVERWVTIRRTLPTSYVAALEEAPGARPMHWWVSRVPVPVVYESGAP